MPTESEKIPYVEVVKKEFLKTAARISEIEQNFKLDMSDEYSSLKKKVMNLAVELVKQGISPQIKYDVVSIVVDGIEYEFVKKAIKDEIGTHDYEIIFNDYEYNFDDDNAEKNDQTSYKDNSRVENCFPFMGMSPFTGYPTGPGGMPFMPFPVFTGGFNLPDNNKDGEKALAATQEMSKELSTILERLDALEKHPESAVNNEEYENLMLKYETLKKEYDETIEKNKVLLLQKDDLAEKNDSLTVKLNDAIDSLQSLKDKSEKDIQNVKEQCSLSVSEEITRLETENSKLASDNEQLKQDLKTCRSELNNARAERNRANEEINNASYKKQEEIDRAVTEALARERVMYNEKFKEYEKTVADLKNQLDSAGDDEDYSQTIRDMTVEINNLKIERDSLKKNVELLTSEKEQLQSDKLRRLDEMKTLESKVERLSDVAYLDTKTRAKSNIAFNEEFNNFDKNNLILAVVGIRGMKEINDQWGRASGDKVIANVAEELITEFPNGHIYRVMGDQFIIVDEGVTLNYIQGQLSDAARKLALDDIYIAYGTAVGNSCSDYSDIINVAESNLNRMKNMPVANEGENDIYQSARQAVSPIAPKVKKKKNDDIPQEVNLDEEIAKFMESGM